MDEPIVELEGVEKRYAGHVAVRGLSLRVSRGVIYGLLGPNGAGKTTTLRMINDIIKPDVGRITLFGRLAPGRAAALRIGYLPEERGLYTKMTVRRVLTFLAELRGLDRAELARRITRWLERLDLGAWIDRKVEELSKGMQQKVQFVAALLHEPDLLILDEPFSGLDPINADLLRAIVREQKAAGRTILFSTHLMEHAEQLCDAVCIIAEAEKVLDGPLTEVKREARETRRAVRMELDPRRPDRAVGLPVALAPGANPAIARATITGSDTAGDRFEVELAAGATAGELLRYVAAEGLDVVRFEHVEPTLHEIFVSRVQARRGGAAREANHG